MGTDDTEIVAVDRMLIKQLWDEIERALGSNREYLVLMYRYKVGMTLEAIGEKLGVSSDVVKREGNVALKRLRSNKDIRGIGRALGYGIPKQINSTSNTLATNYP